MTKNGVEVIFNASLCPENELNPTTVVECEKGTIEYIDFNRAVITYENGKRKEIKDNSEQRVYMLERLYDSYKKGEGFACTLETCRPFTVSVNAAFESCGKINDIDKKYITRHEQGDSVKTVINNIEHILKVSHENGKIFSELGISWAKQSQPVNTLDYSCFQGLSGVNL